MVCIEIKAKDELIPAVYKYEEVKKEIIDIFPCFFV